MIPKKALPPVHNLLDLRTSQSKFSLTTNLPLGRRKTLILHIIQRYEHFLDADQIRRQIFLETTRDKRARCIPSCEEVVASTWSVDGSVGGDVEDGAVDSEVDREGGIGAIV